MNSIEEKAEETEGHEGSDPPTPPPTRAKWMQEAHRSRERLDPQTLTAAQV